MSQSTPGAGVCPKPLVENQEGGQQNLRLSPGDAKGPKAWWICHLSDLLQSVLSANSTREGFEV